MALETETVHLKTPFKQGDKKVKSVLIRKPLGGDLRGCLLANLVQMDVESVARLVPRISEPLIDEATFYSLDAADITSIAIAVTGFLVGESIQQPPP